MYFDISHYEENEYGEKEKRRLDTLKILFIYQTLTVLINTFVCWLLFR